MSPPYTPLSGELSSYLPLPGAGASVHVPASRPWTLCFAYGGEVLSLPWANFNGANYRREAGKVIIELEFLAHVVIVTFEGEGLLEADRCWQECLDEQRSLIEEQPSRCRIQIYFDDFTVHFDRVYPYKPGKKKKKTWFPEDDPFP